MLNGLGALCGAVVKTHNIIVGWEASLHPSPLPDGGPACPSWWLCPTAVVEWSHKPTSPFNTSFLGKGSVTQKMALEDRGVH